MPTKSMLILIAALAGLLALLTRPVAGAPLPDIEAQPSPRPTLATTPSSAPPPAPAKNNSDDHDNNDDDDDDDSGPRSAIFGTVSDLSSGRPGTGLPVSVNGAIVTTDSAGRYSITGLVSGEYTVVLQLPGEWWAAQEPLAVHLDGQNSVTVDLAYYSQSPPTATPLPTPTPLPPILLPETGASSGGWFLITVGLLLVVGGSLLFKYV
jgi:LPXTG-motif cell wall-anchored protein